ncbi:MAG: prepilin-type N-terminal cleavage/methylation domain-containing protein [Tepidisphaeraceae bacterium]
MRQSLQCRRPRGFTLVEILVVIGIIVILVGILVPVISRSMREAKRTRIAADMQAIGTALEAFRADHGDYPRVGTPNLGAALLGRNLAGPLGDGYLPGSASVNPDDPQDPPAHVAGMMYLPGDAVNAGNVNYVALVETTTTPPVVNVWVACGAVNQGGATDGADGPGIRMRPGGKKWGPYVQEGKFKLRGLAILDIFDNPILYFPAGTGKPNVTIAGGYLPTIQTPTPVNVDTALYDTSDNWVAFQRPTDADARPAQQRIHAMLGDIIMNGSQEGAIDTASGEPEAQSAPFLLWSAGPDGLYGPTDITLGAAPADLALNRRSVDKCDDVTNFPR